jgi:hypothetical protein
MEKRFGGGVVSLSEISDGVGEGLCRLKVLEGMVLFRLSLRRLKNTNINAPTAATPAILPMVAPAVVPADGDDGGGDALSRIAVALAIEELLEVIVSMGLALVGPGASDVTG